MNILVTGANGQLGLELRNLTAHSENRFLFSDVCTIPDIETLNLDITDIEAVRIIAEAEDIDVIVNCAAYTNVDKSEDNVSMAELLNATAVDNLAQVCKERNATLIHISTDYVFGGRVNEPLTEESLPDPIGAYGATKLMGELKVQKSGCKYLIFRTAWLYSPYGKNFVKTMMQLTAERDNLKVVYDQIGSPTYAGDLAKLIFQVIEKNQLDQTGLYHFTDEGVISWYDFAKAICEIAGNQCDIRPCRTAEYPTRSQRPAYSVLDKAKVKKTFGITIPYWKDSLVNCIELMKP